jgi:hypothetical protein
MTMLDFLAAGTRPAVIGRFDAPLSTDAVRATIGATNAGLPNIKELLGRFPVQGDLHVVWSEVLRGARREYSRVG